ncbi:MAG: UDP-N-acetylglucosamine 2-epimerase (non-hydrolyzing) [Bacteroidales bacterium]
MTKILSVVGARPNFMKIAPFVRAIEEYNNLNGDRQIMHILVHTGQHYDIRMSGSFFASLGIPDPDVNLEVGSGSHSEQVGQTMIAIEKVLLKERPDWLVVVGDVNATLACSVAAKKLGIKVCHIEAGLRSGDMSMPEEINRLVTDRLSDLLLTPDTISSENLRKEGMPEKSIVFVGNIMIDTLEENREKAAALQIKNIIGNNLVDGFSFDADSFDESRYALMTIHRPSNVDEKEVFGPLTGFLINEVSTRLPLVWPIHPRARKNLERFGLWEQVRDNANILMLEPLGYQEMLRMNMGAAVMLTDSGGLQEECCVLGTPCLTLRWNTERPVTLKEFGGAGVLVGNNVSRIREEFLNTLAGESVPLRPELWDGNTARRCVEAIVNFR